jgi:type I restriction enzyme R subunit
MVDDGRSARVLLAHGPGLGDDFTGAMQLLRSPAFLDLLEHYPRASRTFLVAYETEDEVSSQWLIRDGSGHEYKPEDYLAAFATFVRDNPEHVEAIRILLDRPEGWSPRALTELRQKLATAPQRFTEETLRKAHRLRYDKALVDIISMVKHAARDEAPLFTATERVDRAIATVTAGRTFTPDQGRWLEHIRAHLVESLSLDLDDFDLIPVFTRDGGLAAASRAFGGTLKQLVSDVNAAIAA